ncbi:ferredoxin [Rhodococcus sp. NPDC003382]
MQITADYGKCQGNGLCEGAAPSHFTVTDDGLVEIIKSDVAPAELAAVETAVSSCPTLAIRLQRD